MLLVLRPYWIEPNCYCLPDTLIPLPLWVLSHPRILGVVKVMFLAIQPLWESLALQPTPDNYH